MAASLALTVSPALNPRLRTRRRHLITNLTFPFLLHPPPSLSLPRPRLLTATETDAFAEMDRIETERRSGSSMPEVFRQLSIEVPENSVRWPWLIPMVLFVYGWKAVLWELNNWKKSVIAVFHFLGYLGKSIGKLILGFVCHFMGDQVIALLSGIEFAYHCARSLISDVVFSAPVPDITTVILLTSAVLAVAEATAPNSVNDQPYLLTTAGLVGFGFNLGVVPDVILWLIPVCFFLYSKFFKKRNAVSAALPCAALLVSVSVPWLRGLAMATYFALATFHYHPRSTSNATIESGDNLGGRGGSSSSSMKLPLVLLMAGLSIGIHLAFKWLRHRHLTWMIV